MSGAPVVFENVIQRSFALLIFVLALFSPAYAQSPMNGTGQGMASLKSGNTAGALEAFNKAIAVDH
ncbi:MAG: hypothetical protein KGJ11_04880, partial [Candidatus Omnitrophica bacterium]|nr:hypothetical protein [Candidatus Omnitrophota bacterium]